MEVKTPEESESPIDITRVQSFVDLFVQAANDKSEPLFKEVRSPANLTSQIKAEFLGKIKLAGEDIGDGVAMMRFLDPLDAKGLTFNEFRATCDALGLKYRDLDLGKAFQSLDSMTRDGFLSVSDL
jgi:hypothetical protein